MFSMYSIRSRPWCSGGVQAVNTEMASACPVLHNQYIVAERNSEYYECLFWERLGNLWRPHCSCEEKTAMILILVNVAVAVKSHIVWSEIVSSTTRSTVSAPVTRLKRGPRNAGRSLSAEREPSAGFPRAKKALTIRNQCTRTSERGFSRDECQRGEPHRARMRCNVPQSLSADDGRRLDWCSCGCE